jgi:hypothetical protein
MVLIIEVDLGIIVSQLVATLQYERKRRNELTCGNVRLIGRGKKEAMN